MGKLKQLKDSYKLIGRLNSKEANEDDRKQAEDLVDSIVGKKTRLALTKRFTKQKKEKEGAESLKKTSIKDA